jgi:hypothetical protein
MTADTTALEPVRSPVRSLPLLAWFAVAGHLLLALTLVGVLSLIWALTTPGEAYWPVWLACVSGLLLAWHAGIAASVHGLPGAGQGIRLSRVAAARFGLEIHAVVTLSIVAFLWAIWGAALTAHAVGGGDPPWPVWVTVPALGALSVHATIVFLHMRSASYAARIEELTASRAGVLEAQELELRRIERDLHDGTQARLVALGMQLGLAEQQLRRDPARARELVADAAPPHETHSSISGIWSAASIRPCSRIAAWLQPSNRSSPQARSIPCSKRTCGTGCRRPWRGPCTSPPPRPSPTPASTVDPPRSGSRSCAASSMRR